MNKRKHSDHMGAHMQPYQLQTMLRTANIFLMTEVKVPALVANRKQKRNAAGKLFM